MFLVTLVLVVPVQLAPLAHVPAEHTKAIDSSSDGDNLLDNPSFEAGTDSPTGWKHRGICGSTLYAWDATHSHDGARSVGIRNASASCNPDNYWYSVDYTPVDFEQASYLFSAFYTYRGNQEDYPSGAIGLFAYDADKRALDTLMFSCPPSRDDWTYTHVFIDNATMGSNYAQVKFIRVGLFATARHDHLNTELRFDDIFFGVAGDPSENTRPDAPAISGPSTGKTGTAYTYSFTTVDPDGDPVSLWIQWGDGTTAEEWMGPYASGETVSLAHVWETNGTYTISATARDIHGAEGGTTTLTVSMPLRHQTLREKICSCIQRILQIYTPGSR